MYTDKTTLWLKRAIRQHKRVIHVFRYRYFWSDDKDFDTFRKAVLSRLLHQLKLMEEEYDERMRRT